MKKLVIVAIIVASLAISATVAFAWWTGSSSIADNNIGTGMAGITVEGLPLNFADLQPMNDPDPTADVDAQDYPAETFVRVTNTEDTPLMFYGFLSGATGDVGYMNKVNVRIWVAPIDGHSPYGTGDFQNNGGNPYLSYEGTLYDLISGGQTFGMANLASRFWTGTAWVHTPLMPGSQAVYKIGCWLDASANDDYQGKHVNFSWDFAGVQEGDWVDVPYMP